MRALTLKTISCAATAAALFAATSASAATNLLTNGSFETLPAGGLTMPCAGTCRYSVGGIPGWTTYGATGLFQPGADVGNTTYFNSVPNGSTVAYSNGGWISQIVGSAVAGTWYSLSVAVGHRNDGYYKPGTMSIMIGGTPVSFATGAAATTGDWSTFTTTYRATAADNGKTLGVKLTSKGAQGDWDNVVLTSAVPEPATWAMMIAGFGMVGASMRRRRRGSAILPLAVS